VAFYALKRFGAVLVILAVMTVLVFLATHALPANTAQMILGQYATPATRSALEHKLGLDLPLSTQYWRWADGMLHGSFGDSLLMERPIAPVLWDALGKSAVLAIAAMAIVTILGLTLGVIAAVRRGRWPDHAVSVFAYLGLSVPEYYWGLVLILVFASTFHLLPSSGAGTLSDGVGKYAAHLVLPVITLTLSFLAHVSRLTRSSMLEVLDTNYVKAARARGLPEYKVILRHALRNALLPSITVLAQDFGYLIGGIVAVETIFAYPGIGRLLIYSLERLDLPMMQAATLVLTAIYCLANLAADLLYGFVNPRIRYGGALD
jgi:peptide/nickel transport system permease protein